METKTMNCKTTILLLTMGLGLFGCLAASNHNSMSNSMNTPETTMEEKTMNEPMQPAMATENKDMMDTPMADHSDTMNEKEMDSGMSDPMK